MCRKRNAKISISQDCLCSQNQRNCFDSKLASEENRETDGSAIITPEEEGYAPFKVNHEYVRKHNPQVGGYYVVYKDGYKSWSPAEVFEKGYTKL